MGIDLTEEFGHIVLTEPFSLKYLLYQFWYDVGDRRTDNYHIIKCGPWLTIAIVCAYLLFCTKIGPYMMRYREPLELRRLIFIYNLIMVVLNLKYLKFSVQFLNYGRDLLNHSTVSRDDYSSSILWEINEMHIYFITKFIDLFDTIFFVLRKKQNQVTVLHLYHHSIVPILCWLAFRLMPTFKPLGIFVILNCFIHVLMYSYYALASFGPEVQRYLWWKKYITILQLTQFVVYMVYGSYMALFVIQNSPQYLPYIVHIQSPVFFIMFLHFYRKAYSKNNNNIRALKRESNNNFVKISGVNGSANNNMKDD